MKKDGYRFSSRHADIFKLLLMQTYSNPVVGGGSNDSSSSIFTAVLLSSGGNGINEGWLGWRRRTRRRLKISLNNQTAVTNNN